MSKTRNTSRSENDSPIVMSDLEKIVQKAVEAAMDVFRNEFGQRLIQVENIQGDFDRRLAELEARFDATEEKLTRMTTQLTASTPEVDSIAKELEEIKKMNRNNSLHSNDNEQFSRRNNLRIRGLQVPEGQDCVPAVVNFIRTRLHKTVEAGDIDIAHSVSRRQNEASSATGTNVTVPHQTVESSTLVRFSSRSVRDDIIRRRKALKGSRFSIVEDLTVLNMQTMNRLNRSDSVRKTWSWNGKLYALLTTGEKVTVRPYQSLEDSVICT